MLILASWAGTLGWLSWRIYHRGASTFISGSTPILPPDAHFYIVRSAGDQVGVASITIDTLVDGVQIIERLGLDLPLRATSSRSQYLVQYTLGTDLRLKDFRVTIPGKAAPVVQQGVIDGDSLITVTPGTGEPRWRFRALTGALLPPLAAPVALALQQKLQSGERLSVPVFDPLTLSHDTIVLTVLQDSVFLIPDSALFDSLSRAWVPAHSDTLRGWKLNWANHSQSVQMWVDHRGLPLQIISPAGLSLERTAFEIVTINYRRRGTLPLNHRPNKIVLRTTIAAEVEPPRNVMGMRVRLTAAGQDWSLPDRPDASWQGVDGNLVVVTPPPIDTTIRTANADSLLESWVQDAPHLSLGDSTIARQARAIVRNERIPGVMTARLAQWVSDSINRVTDPVVPRAATVLRERQADVDGHTLLFVALARSLGLPARSVSGILLAGERFYLHSWAEVHLGTWIPVDPTWGEFPATANRIRISVGTLARATDLLPQLAGLDAELITLTQHP